MNFHHILTQRKLISSVSPCQPDLIHIPAGLLQGEPVLIKQDRYAELVKTQQVQQHGAKAGEDRNVGVGVGGGGEWGGGGDAW